MDSDAHDSQPTDSTALHAEMDTGLRLGVCESEDDIRTCWELVYRSYRRIGLIEPNAQRIHTHQWACSPNAAVFYGKIGDLTVSTISAYLDDPKIGLPLDSVYTGELAKLRREGRQLMEIGLFADRREHLYRSIGVILELMRWATWFGVTHGATDGIIGVHPHHAKFYTRMLGFDTIGDEKSYDVVNGKPVVLLRLDWPGKTEAAKLPRGLQHFVDNPVTREIFDRRAWYKPRPAQPAAAPSASEAA